MHGSHRGIWRTSSAPRAAIVYELLQRHAHSLVIEQGCADIARGRARWKHSLLSNPWRSPSPIYPDLISGRDREADIPISTLWPDSEVPTARAARVPARGDSSSF